VEAQYLLEKADMEAGEVSEISSRNQKVDSFQYRKALKTKVRLNIELCIRVILSLM
jgi:hypothetical protein